MKIVMIGAAILLAANTVWANAENEYGAVLPEGAKLVAGDMTKNEFYILGKDEKLPLPLSGSREHRAHSQKLASATEGIINKKPSIILAKKHLASSAKATNKLAIDKKVVLKLKTAFNDKERKKVDKFLRELVDKKEVFQLRKALKHADQKAINANIHKLAGKKTFLKLQHELAHQQHILLKDKRLKQQLARTHHSKVRNQRSKA